LARHLVRLNETALMVDARLGDPGALPSGTALRLHQLLFDAELALTNVARFTQAMAHLPLPKEQKVAVRAALAELCQGRSGQAKAAAARLASLVARSDVASADAGHDRVEVVIPHRFAGSVTGFVDALDAWMLLGASENAQQAAEVFTPAVALFAGWLPGSARASAAASAQGGRRWWDQFGIPPYLRTAVQLGVAVGLAIAVGVQINPQRFYWAVAQRVLQPPSAHPSRRDLGGCGAHHPGRAHRLAASHGQCAAGRYA
jgi:hypothetical protein